jgi:membrane-bound metal-dependent hydrolase YbcI (DUF457 family)
VIILYPIGHFALGYFSAKLGEKITKKQFNIYLVCFLSILPDFDIFFPFFLVHRGVTHSFITTSIIFIPLILLNKKTIPYYLSILSHSLIGDYFTSYGIKLFWPMSNEYYKFFITLSLNNPIEYMVETFLIILMISNVYKNIRTKN